MINKSIKEILREHGCSCKNCDNSLYSKYYNGGTLFCSMTLDNYCDETHGEFLCFDYIPKEEFINISVIPLNHIKEKKEGYKNAKGIL